MATANAYNVGSQRERHPITISNVMSLEGTSHGVPAHARPTASPSRVCWAKYSETPYTNSRKRTPN